MERTSADTVIMLGRGGGFRAWYRQRKGITPVVGWTIGLAAAGFGLLLFAPPVWAATRLDHPATSVAAAARAWDPCARCTTVARATFFDANGVLRHVRLRTPVQDLAYYRPGITIVYDVRTPARAMASRDYRDGRSWSGRGGLLVSTVVALGETVLAVRYLRRRRRAERRGVRGDAAAA